MAAILANPVPSFPDSTKKNSTKISTSALDSRIDYNSSDSIVFDVDSGIVFLYNKAAVNYGDLKLNADYIQMDTKNNVVKAQGAKDSLGKLSGNPEFSQAEQNFKAKSMSYNFETKKGRINDVITKEGEGYIHGETIKKDTSNSYYIKNGKYTTCADEDHPHFYIAAEKLRVIPDDKVVTGPANLWIGDIPTPLAVPFGFFPLNKGQKSGILIPEPGEADNLGFFLKNGGYYFGISDKLDLTLLGDVYSRGSWTGKVISNYNKRYKYDGDISLGYSNIVVGEKELPNFDLSQSFFVKWQHAQDPKSRPNSRFSANVNAGSANYNRFNSTNTNQYLTNTFQSSISYQKTFANTPFSLSVNARHSQNTLTRKVDISAPDITFAAQRYYLFRQKNKVGEYKWYENIGASYTNTLRNDISFIDSTISQPTFNALDHMKYGMKHSVPITTSVKFLKFFTFNPFANLYANQYLKTYKREWNSVKEKIDTVTVDGLKTSLDYSVGTSVNTKLYGMLQFKKCPVKAVRHVLTPDVGFTYIPGLGKYDSIQNPNITDPKLQYTKYTLYDGTIYGGASPIEAGNITFGLNNNLEMKVKSKKDTASGTKKIKIFENLGINSFYNIIAKEFNLAPIRISARTQLFKDVAINYNAGYDPYVLDVITGNRLNIYEWNQNQRIGRLTDANASLSFSLRSKKTATDKKRTDRVSKDEMDKINSTSYDYVDYTVPWNVSISYNITYSKPVFVSTLTQSVRFYGDVNITEKWKIGFDSGYDFITNKLTQTTLDIYRDLHCWEMKFHVVPFGSIKSYSFDLKVKASTLQDLKLSRRRSWYDLQ